MAWRNISANYYSFDAGPNTKEYLYGDWEETWFRLIDLVTKTDKYFILNVVTTHQGDPDTFDPFMGRLRFPLCTHPDELMRLGEAYWEKYREMLE